MIIIMKYYSLLYVLIPIQVHRVIEVLDPDPHPLSSHTTSPAGTRCPFLYLPPASSLANILSLFAVQTIANCVYFRDFCWFVHVEVVF